MPLSAAQRAALESRMVPNPKMAAKLEAVLNRLGFHRRASGKEGDRQQKQAESLLASWHSRFYLPPVWLAAGGSCLLSGRAVISSSTAKGPGGRRRSGRRQSREQPPPGQGGLQQQGQPQQSRDGHAPSPSSTPASQEQAPASSPRGPVDRNQPFPEYASPFR